MKTIIEKDLEAYCRIYLLHNNKQYVIHIDKAIDIDSIMSDYIYYYKVIVYCGDYSFYTEQYSTDQIAVKIDNLIRNNLTGWNYEYNPF